MKSLSKNPYLLFWLLIPVILVAGFFDKQILSVSIHADYYVFSKSDLCILISYLLGILGLGYWFIKIAKRKLFKWLNFIHILTTIGGIIVLFITQFFFVDDDLVSPNSVFVLTGLVMFFGQLFYLINLGFGIFRKDNS
jgi:hypothetical protein